MTWAIGVGIWWLVRDDPNDKGYTSHALIHNDDTTRISASVLTGIRAVLRYRNTWLLYLVPGAVVGSVLTFAGLWGVPYLTTHYDMQQTTAAAVCSALLIAWAIGGPVFGGLSDHLGHRKPLYAIGCLVQLVGWSLILLLPALPVWLLVLLLIVVGFFSGNMIIGFAFAKESVPSYLAGTVTGMVNMGVMMGPMLLQPGVGWVLDLRWQGEIDQGVRIYTLEAYQSGFSLMLAWLALAFLLILRTADRAARTSLRRRQEREWWAV